MTNKQIELNNQVYDIVPTTFDDPDAVVDENGKPVILIPAAIVSKKSPTPIWFYIVLGLVAFGLIGPDLGYLSAVTFIVGGAAAVGLFIMSATNNRTYALLCTAIALLLIVATNMDENAYYVGAKLAGSLTNISWVVVGVIVAAVLERMLRRS